MAGRPARNINSGFERRNLGSTATILRGECSYYGAKFHGKKTANGEVFDMHAFTAAHKELPFGTVLKVTNLENNKSVIVRINDRGPFVRGRILDVSYAAAEKLDMIRSGTAQITAELIE